MIELTKEQIQEVKAQGFLRNRGTNCFSGRIVAPGGVFTSRQLEAVSYCAKQYGNGKIAFTTRLTAEIVGIPYEKIKEAQKYIQETGLNLSFGGTGAKIRPVTACKGTTCVFGSYDTQEYARLFHEKYYLGMPDLKLPHKFKIAVGGCPNSCMKPSLNDFGIEPRKKQGELFFQVYTGGTWGKKTRIGNTLSQLVPAGDIFKVLDRILEWYRINGLSKERFGASIDRVGIDSLEAYIFQNN